MAWIELDPRTGFFKIGFRLGERKVKRSLQSSDRTEADAACGVVEQTLMQSLMQDGPRKSTRACSRVLQTIIRHSARMRDIHGKI
jgi:hypothetical protein